MNLYSVLKFDLNLHSIFSPCMADVSMFNNRSKIQSIFFHSKRPENIPIQKQKRFHTHIQTEFHQFKIKVNPNEFIYIFITSQL